MLTLYAFVSIKPFIPWAVYYADYDHIVNDLCINRDKPYLDCKGSCYVNALRKRLGEENLPAQNTPVTKKVEAPLLYIPAKTMDYDLYFSCNKFKIHPRDIVLKSQEVYNRLLRPPQIA